MALAFSRIDGRYRILQSLGEGLSGEVYLVDGPEGRAALKLLKPFADRELEESLISAFKFEFGLLKDLNHPNVVRIQEFGFDPALKRFYFTEEFLAGRPIHEYGKSAAPERIEALFLQALQGLQAIHRAHILHGDIQTNNFLVVETPSGPLLKIIDLGLADPRFPFTAGTPATMAPEKILRDAVDERSDLYSLGVVFYQLFTGENPFVRETIQKTYEAHLSHRPPKVTLKNPKVPLFFNEIFANLLAKNPLYRYRRCAEVLEAIDLAKPQAGGPAAKPDLWRPELWMVRPGITEELFQEILEAWRSPRSKKPSAFLITGEAGVGKSRLAQDIKYRFQMEKGKTHEIRPEREFRIPSPSEATDLWIVEDWQLLEDTVREQLLKERAQPSTLTLFTAAPEDAIRLENRLEKAGFFTRRLEIPPFSERDLQDFLERLTGIQEIPKNFLEGLWRNTRGNPKQVIGVLQNLVQQKKLIDARGRWNLVLFKESEWDQVALPLEIPQIDQELARLLPEDHERRAQLWMQRGEELLKKNLLAEAAAALHEAEKACERLSDLTRRFSLKARIHEKTGYRLIREGNLESARLFLEKALTLLAEAGVADEVLAIRANNFLAWLLCQEGKIDPAIERFLEQHERWRQLAPAEKVRVLNNDLGSAYLLKGDGKRAVVYLQEHLEFFEKVEDAPSRMKVHYNLAEAYTLTKDFAKAVEHYLRAAEMARQEKNYEFLLRAYNGLGKTHQLQGAIPKALEDYRRALELARYLEEFSSAAAIAQNIGSLHSENGEYEAAQSHFEIALKMTGKLKQRSAHDKYLQCRALLEMGDLFRKQKRFEEALGYVHEAHQLAAQEESLKNFRFWVVYTQCKVEKDQGRLDKLQDLLAELLPLAEDDTQREAAAEFAGFLPTFPYKPPLKGAALGKEGESMDLLHTFGEENFPPPDKWEEKMNINQTRREVFSPASSHAPELKALIQVARWLASERDPDRLLGLIVRQAVELSSAEAGLLLLEEETGDLKVQAAVNLNVDDPLRKMSENVAKEVLTTGRPVLTGNALEDERFKVYESVVAHRLQSILALPVPGLGPENRRPGVLALLHRFRTQVFTPEKQELMAAFADLAAAALENARLVAELTQAKNGLAQDLERAEEELDQARRSLSESSLVRRFARSDLQSQNKEMVALFQLVERIKDTSLSVLLRGESGTGKERIARVLHRHSRRAKAPFVAVNCAAIPAHLIESELFGYKAGAFTGATRDKKGLIAEAHGGSLFLDEIAELDVGLQAKLLRVLQEKELTRVGDTKTVSVDFRLVSATHQDLKRRVAEGKFREDLFYRICEIELTIPPLRERKEDIALLAEVFIRQYLEEHGEKAKIQVGRDLMKAWMEYSWPGNIRELENAVRVAVALRRGNAIHLSDLPASLQNQLLRAPVSAAPPAPSSSRPARVSRNASPELFDPEKSWEEMELLLIAKALVHHHFDVVRAAKSLDCAPSKLYQRLREHGLDQRREEWEQDPFAYREAMKLTAVKREVFRQALAHWGGSPYQTAKALGVSPGMVYKWTE